MIKEIIESNSEVEKIDTLGDPEKIERGLRRRKIYKSTDKPDLSRLKETDNFALKFDNIKDRVISLLRTDKFARKNDLWLLLLYYHRMGYLKLQIGINDFNRIDMPESISRARRSIFEDIRHNKLPELKFLLEDTETLEIRKAQEENYHNYFKDKKNAETAEDAK